MSDNLNKMEMSDEEYLRKHIESLENSNNNNNLNENIKNPKITDFSKSSDLSYFNFDVKELPCGKFYPDGTMIMVRPATVKEIQAYSMVDDNNIYDVVEKMNDMLQSCVRVKYSNGKISSFLDIKDQDRLYILFLIRELTFQQGNTLNINTKCLCGNDVSIPMIRKNFVFYEIDEKLYKYFDNYSKTFKFCLKNGKEYELSVPNIGIQKSFTEYILEENKKRKKLNLAFLKIAPFLLPNRNSITIEGIEAKLKEFEKMDDMSFQFLNSVVSKMTFGIKELKTFCSNCGVEVRSQMSFPNGASDIFVIHDAFETYIKE